MTIFFKNLASDSKCHPKSKQMGVSGNTKSIYVHKNVETKTYFPICEYLFLFFLFKTTEINQ